METPFLLLEVVLSVCRRTHSERLSNALSRERRTVEGGIYVEKPLVCIT
jgi:hypothetical protein